MGKVSPLIKHGEITAAVGFCDLCEHMFTRITKELDDSGKKNLPHRAFFVLKSSIATDLETTPKGSMRHILRLLETFRWRSRRILRSLKRLGNQLEVCCRKKKFFFSDQPLRLKECNRLSSIR